MLTECARIKDLLDRVQKSAASGEVDRDVVKTIGLLTSQRRGLLRELGLTLQPSRTLVKTIAKSGEPGSKWGDKLKIAGY